MVYMIIERIQSKSNYTIGSVLMENYGSFNLVIAPWSDLEGQFANIHLVVDLFMVSSEKLEIGDCVLHWNEIILIDESNIETYQRSTDYGTTYKIHMTSCDNYYSLPKIPKDFLENYVREYNTNNQKLKYIQYDYEDRFIGKEFFVKNDQFEGLLKIVNKSGNDYFGVTSDRDENHIKVQLSDLKKCYGNK